MADSELGRIEQIEGQQFTVALDDGRRVRFDAGEFRHLDHGYAVTSYSSQGQTVERVIITANTTEPEVLLNQRMSYVAVSRAREDAVVYTNSEAELGAALDRQVDKQMALEAVHEAQPVSRQAEHPPPAVAQEHSHHAPDQRQRQEVNDRGYGMSW
ncbi:MAG: ATP-binding domain-containing protein [Pyrinomonadaceae bacterium]|nr:ATP-binding domain-containing protein [Pyrinomonadaceae bacterium]